VPTGSGGLWALTVLEATLVDGVDTRPLIPGLIGAATPLTFLHPGILDGHHIFAQRDEVKYQYGCFFESFFATGRAVVSAPAVLGTPCLH
jgi:hypothetical protein